MNNGERPRANCSRGLFIQIIAETLGSPSTHPKNLPSQKLMWRALKHHPAGTVAKRALQQRSHSRGDKDEDNLGKADDCFSRSS